jgi:hypothetical protein
LRMKKMCDLAINPRKGRKKGKAVRIDLRLVLTAYKNFFHAFLCSLYVGFVPVSNLLDMYSLIWRGVFLSKFLFVTDPKPKFDWRVFGGLRSPKTFHVLGDPKRFTKTLQCCWGCLDLAMPLGLSNFQIYVTILAIYHLRPAYIV